MNLIALLTRLTSTCLARSGSVWICRGISLSNTMSNVSPFFIAQGRVSPTTSATSCGRSQWIFSTVTFCASILEMSRMSLMMASRCSPLRRIVRQQLCRSSGVWLGSSSISAIAHDRGHGRADFVAGVGQERALGEVGQLGGFLGLVQLFLGELAGGDVLVADHQPGRSRPRGTTLRSSAGSAV